MRIPIVFISVFILFSCDSPIRFEVPQPEGRPDENSIPKKLIGQYSSLKDSSALTIAGGIILKSKITDFSTLVSLLDSADRVTIKGDTTFSVTEVNMKMNVTVRGDSVFERLEEKDTIFSTTRGDVLRKFKGRYLVNHQTSKNSWSVTLLTKVNGGIVLGTVSTQEDIKNLRELTGTLSDTTRTTFRPRRDELKKFLERNGFGSQESYIRIE